jgi:hypothetical protein
VRLRDADALAVDYDRTLTDERLQIVPDALVALRDARAAGRRIVIVSGRGLDFLERAVGDVADVIVAENGALLRGPRGRLELRPGADLLKALESLDVPWERGSSIASVDLVHEGRLADAIARAGVKADIVRNRDRVMAVPVGTTKADGLLAALRLLGASPERTVAFGDGENDAVMLEAVGHGVAVANAVDELKAIADDVTTRPGGLGVMEWVRAHA